jgi:hypothetical protein
MAKENGGDDGLNWKARKDVLEALQDGFRTDPSLAAEGQQNTLKHFLAKRKTARRAILMGGGSLLLFFGIIGIADFASRMMQIASGSSETTFSPEAAPGTIIDLQDYIAFVERWQASNGSPSGPNYLNHRITIPRVNMIFTGQADATLFNIITNRPEIVSCYTFTLFDPITPQARTLLAYTPVPADPNDQVSLQDISVSNTNPTGFPLQIYDAEGNPLNALVLMLDGTSNLS